jgi:hypothetical protein
LIGFNERSGDCLDPWVSIINQGRQHFGHLGVRDLTKGESGGGPYLGASFFTE